ncbi:MAG TPA: hypothetical protein VH083_08190 [Myxococcales bacterium]|nr:hypothetical protein [Myxococcales bacterium]
MRRPRVILAIAAVVLGTVLYWKGRERQPVPTELSITDGSRVRIECAGISVAPEAAWGLERFDTGEPDPSKPRLCSPKLFRKDATITVLTLPKSADSLSAQADAFLSKLHLEGLRKEELATAAGQRAVHAHGSSPKSNAIAIQIDAFLLLNAEGRLAVVYSTGLEAENVKFVDWFPKTVELLK